MFLEMCSVQGSKELVQLNDVGYSLRSDLTLQSTTTILFSAHKKAKFFKTILAFDRRCLQTDQFMTDLYYDCFDCEECLSYWKELVMLNWS